MKKILILALLLINSICLLAQSPRGMNYQAVARDKSGNVLADHEISLRVDLSSQLEKNQTIYYTEYHKARTNALGLFTLIIGEGGTDQNNFDNVPWATEDIWMAISIQDQENGDYATITNTKLLAVPYAYYAVTASELVNKNDSDGIELDIRSNASNVWSLDGNYKTNPTVHKLGTNDYKDLVIVSNNIERLRVLANGLVNIKNTLTVGSDIYVANSAHISNVLNVSKDANLNNDGGSTVVNGRFLVNKEAPSNLTGDLTVDGNTELNRTLTVSKEAPTHLTGTLNVNQATDLDQSLNVDGTTTLNGGLTVANGAPTVLTGSLNVNDLNIDHSFIVDGITTLNDALTVANNASTTLTGTLNVKEATDLDQSLNVDGTTTLHGTLTVADESSTVLTGDLYANKNAFVNEHFEVAGTTYLFGETLIGNYARIYGLQVDGMRPTQLTGRLDVDGNAIFNKRLTVHGKAVLDTLEVTGPSLYSGNIDYTGDLTVHGFTTLKKELYANKKATFSDGFTTQGTAYFGGSINATKYSIFQQGLQTSGSVNISSDVNGPDYAWGSYPLMVEGSNQGIYILVDGSATEANNFMSFASHNGGIKGCIEGQTLAEKKESFDYIWAAFMLAFDIAQPTLEAIACAVNVPTDAGEIASNGAAAAVAGTNESQWIQTENNNAGVAFVSGGADYAEWLPKEDKNESFSYGDIVGVNGGNISKTTKGASNFMVVSMAPIVLGNMPPSKEEEKNFEKVAFMGQVPVKVIGKVNIGDFILPSGMNNGLGIAVSPFKMSAKQYREIVGVAWAASNGDNGISLINTAIGISQHVISDKLESMQVETENLKNQVNELNAKMDQVMASLEGRKIEPTEHIIPVVNVAQNSQQLNDLLLDTQLNNTKTADLTPRYIDMMQKQIKSILDARNINYNKYEQTRRLVNDPQYFAQMMESGVLKMSNVK